MNELSVTDARSELPAAISRAQKAPIHILRHGEPVAVLISPTLFKEMLEAMEELDDIAAFDRAVAEKGESFPWEDVKRELGLN